MTSLPAFETLLLDRPQPHVLQVAFNRPEVMNALGTQMGRDVLTLFQSLILDPGDVALFHNRLVHRSGFNPGPRHRFSVQVRFGDLLAPEMLARGWRNRRVDGFETFKSIHPELIHSEEQP
jgi:hypothetical protein